MKITNLRNKLSFKGFSYFWADRIGCSIFLMMENSEKYSVNVFWGNRSSFAPGLISLSQIYIKPSRWNIIFIYKDDVLHGSSQHCGLHQYSQTRQTSSPYSSNVWGCIQWDQIQRWTQSDKNSRYALRLLSFPILEQPVWQQHQRLLGHFLEGQGWWWRKRRNKPKDELGHLFGHLRFYGRYFGRRSSGLPAQLK